MAERESNEAPRVHHASWRRRCRVAARGARTAGGESADHRIAGRCRAATAWSPFVANFVRRLGELGWVEGRTVAIEYRWADARKERFAEKGEKQWQSTSCLRASGALGNVRTQTLRAFTQADMKTIVGKMVKG